MTQVTEKKTIKKNSRLLTVLAGAMSDRPKEQENK